jgi:putative transposase
VDLAEHRWGDDQGAIGGEATGPNPTDRGKLGTKRSVLTEGHGLPIAIVVAAANRNDMKLLAETLEAVVVERPAPTPEAPQHLCADKGYDFQVCREEAAEHGYRPHIRSRGEERRERVVHPDAHPHRWVVEVCHSWLNRFRKILIRFEKLTVTHLALLQFACAYIVVKRVRVVR